MSEHALAESELALRAAARSEYETGRPVKKIAADCGIHFTTVYHWAARYGWRRPQRFSDDDRRVIEQMLDDDVPAAEIARRTGVNVKTVYIWKSRGEMSVDRRGPMLPHSRHSTVPAGPPSSVTFSYIGRVEGAEPGPPSLPPTELGGWWCPCGARYGSLRDLTRHKQGGHIDPRMMP